MLPADTARAAILGVPLQPGKQPSPSGVVRAFEQLDARVIANSAGAIIKNSLTSLNAHTSPAAGAMAWVMGDATVANNGVYENTGTSGSPTWTRRADLPYGVIKAINVGAGTANAIVATSAIPVPSSDGAALIILPIAATNDASPVTVAFNGGSPLTIKSNSGNDIAVGGLQTGMLVAGFKSGTTFRLISDQVSSAIIAQAEDEKNYAREWAQSDDPISEAAGGDGATDRSSKYWAAQAAGSAAGVNLPSIESGDAGSMLVVKEDESGYELLGAEGARDHIGARATFYDYEKLSDAVAATIPPYIKMIRIAGYSAVGDLGGGDYVRVSAEPAHPGKFRSQDRYLPDGSPDNADGGWWELNIGTGRLGVNIEQFGGGVGIANNTPALNDAVDYLRAKGFNCIYFPVANYYNFTERPNTFGFGVRLIGQQSRTGLVRNYSETNAYTDAASIPNAAFLCWDGSDVSAMGGDPNLNKGGGVENLVVKAAENTSGGIALAFTGADVNNRPGFSVVNDLTITADGSGASAGEWAFGVVIDGSLITTSGSRGVRDVSFNNVYVFRCRTEHFLIKAGVHIIANGIDIDDGGLGVTPELRINGDTDPNTHSEDVRINNLGIYGNLAMVNCTSIVILGRCSAYSNTSTATNSVFIGYIASAFTNNSSSMKFYLPGGVS